MKKKACLTVIEFRQVVFFPSTGRFQIQTHTKEKKEIPLPIPVMSGDATLEWEGMRSLGTEGEGKEGLN